MNQLIYLINGPNLNLLGIREPEKYGYDTMKNIEERCEKLAEGLQLKLNCFQSNHEGAIIDWIHEARDQAGGIIINPGAFSHTSIAILDALNCISDKPIIEVHLTNLHKREKFRHHSYISYRADGIIQGFGAEGYELAIRRMGSLLK